MSAFRKIGPQDAIDDTIVLRPSYDVSSGSEGWRGGPIGSASLSLYGGARSTRAVFNAATYTPSFGDSAPYGVPTRVFPVTASIKYVLMRNEAITSSLLNNQRWGREHWNVVMGLYDYYGKNVSPEYTTASYEHYCLYFNRDSANVVLAYPEPIDVAYPSGSFTVEAWIKPFVTQSSGDLTIASRNKVFWFGMTGSNGTLFLSCSAGKFTSSVAPDLQRWSHVAVTGDSTSGSFWIDFAGAGSFQLTRGIVPVPTAYYGAFTIGARWGGTLQDAGRFEPVDGSGSAGTVFHGFVSDVRVWDRQRTQAQLSQSCYTRFVGKSGTLPEGLRMQYTLSEGPLFASYTGSALLGSQSVEPITSGTATDLFGRLRKFDDRKGPVWHPSDNTSLFVVKTFARADSPVKSMGVFHIPSAFYGRQISTGSVRIVCNAFSSASHGLVRTLVDDGRGGLYLSGSACSSSIESKESYKGVEWTKVGNVFYSEGLIVVKDPAIIDLGSDVGGIASHDRSKTIELSFDGVSEVPVKTIMCRVGPGEANCTTNETFYDTEIDGQRIRRHSSGSVYVTAIGLYDSEYRLVGVAKLAQPHRIRPQDRMNFRLRYDF